METQFQGHSLTKRTKSTDSVDVPKRKESSNDVMARKRVESPAASTFSANTQTTSTTTTGTKPKRQTTTTTSTDSVNGDKTPPTTRRLSSNNEASTTTTTRKTRGEFFKNLCFYLFLVVLQKNPNRFEKIFFLSLFLVLFFQTFDDF